MTASPPYGAAEQRQQLDAVASGTLILLCACWGLNQVAIKVALTGISPLLQAGLRSIGALLLVFAWAWARRIPLWRRDGTLVPGVVAGLLFSAEFVFIYWGFMFTTASRGVLFLYTTPFLVAIGTISSFPEIASPG